MRRVWILGFVCAACGDDATSSSASDTEATDTMPPTSSTTASSTATTGDTQDTDEPSTTTGPDPDSSGSSAATEPEESSTGSSTGSPNTDPEIVDDYYLTNTLMPNLAIDANDGVLANDSDVDGDPLAIESFDAATEQGGSVAMMGDGSFAYTPPPAFFGEDRFTYTAGDGAGGTGTGLVRIMVAPTAEPLQTVTGGVAGFAIDPAVDGDHIGVSVRGTGDVNGDGLLDVVIGADRVASDVGAAYVVFGKTDGALVDAANLGAGGFTIDGDAASLGTGYSVAIVGDVNGDGLADIAVGMFESSQTGGNAYVVFGKADTATVQLSSLGAGGFAIVDGSAAVSHLGYAVGGAGDVNGDGLADVIVGAPETNPGGLTAAGVAYVVFGKDDSSDVDVASLGSDGFAIESSTASAHFGTSVNGAGDVDGDGLDDVIVGAPDFMSSQGLAAVVWGKTDTDPVTEAELVGSGGGFVIVGGLNLDDMGLFVAGAGDVNGDGFADVILGAPGVDLDEGNAQGRAYVVHGQNDTAIVDVTDVAAGMGGFVLDGESDFDFAGWSVGGAGDLNGDGLGDILVGAQGADFAAGTAGRAYAVFGRGADTTPVALSDIALGVGGFALDGESVLYTTGWAVDGAGDVNGDGYGDLVLGSPRYSFFDGRAHVVFGGDYLGLVVQPASVRNDVLDGDAAANLLIAGAGDDEITGAGGADVLHGGSGNDVIVVPGGDFFRIDGGTGDDTLRVDGDGEALDLTNFYELAVRNIEIIDLGVTGDNSVFMEWRDLRAMSPESNSLTVTGDMGDTAVIDLSGGTFADQGSAGGFTSWSDGVLTLIVSDDVEVFVSL